MITLKTHFFFLLYLSGTSLSSRLETGQPSMPLERSFKPCGNSIFNIYNPFGIELLTRLGIGLKSYRNSHQSSSVKKGVY